ncbi:MAG: ribonuclease Z [Firmicutes bacterium]|nr:ribonuclease Z [Bacillota bacterium]
MKETMKVKLYGTGALVSKSFSACAMIDDRILFDCPNGLVRKLRQDNIDFGKIATIIISHYHADHDYDMFVLLWEFNRVKRKQQLNIIAPKGFEERYKPLVDMAWPGMFFFTNVMKNVNLNILEAVDAETFELGEYNITAYKMNHANCDAYGYRIKKGERVVAFTGDATMSDNINRLVKGADIAFIDVTGAPPRNSGLDPVHFDIPMFIELKNNHKDVRIMPIHMGDEVYEELKEKGYNVPSDNDVIEI